MSALHRVAFVVLVGVLMGGSAMSKAAETVAEPPAEAVEKTKTVEELVAERAQAYWNAVVAEDYRGTYDLMTPGYRQRTRYERHVVRTQPIARFISASVLKVECQQEDRCSAEVRLTYRDLDTGRTVIKGESSSIVPDTWVRLDGQWWRYQI